MFRRGLGCAVLKAMLVAVEEFVTTTQVSRVLVRGWEGSRRCVQPQCKSKVTTQQQLKPKLGHS